MFKGLQSSEMEGCDLQCEIEAKNNNDFIVYVLISLTS